MKIFFFFKKLFNSALYFLPEAAARWLTFPLSKSFCHFSLPGSPAFLCSVCWLATGSSRRLAGCCWLRRWLVWLASASALCGGAVVLVGQQQRCSPPLGLSVTPQSLLPFFPPRDQKKEKTQREKIATLCEKTKMAATLG